MIIVDEKTTKNWKEVITSLKKIGVNILEVHAPGDMDKIAYIQRYKNDDICLHFILK